MLAGVATATATATAQTGIQFQLTTNDFCRVGSDVFAFPVDDRLLQLVELQQRLLTTYLVRATARINFTENERKDPD